jgi:hypothetical protein
MTTRQAIITDAVTRLKAAAASGVRVYRARLDGLPKGVDRVVSVYAPNERGEALDAGLEHFGMSMTLAIEVRVAAAEDWDAAAGALVEWAKTTLFTDPAWRALFRAPMSFETEQFLVAQAPGELGHCVEILALTLTPKANQEFPLATPGVIAGVDVALDALDPFDPAGEGGPHTAGPDGRLEGEISLDTPPEE